MQLGCVNINNMDNGDQRRMFKSIEARRSQITDRAIRKKKNACFLLSFLGQKNTCSSVHKTYLSLIKIKVVLQRFTE
ncbi:hypothetical protein ACLB2K_033323 [Fragaria x ananassa]